MFIYVARTLQGRLSGIRISSPGVTPIEVMIFERASGNRTLKNHDLFTTHGLMG